MPGPQSGESRGRRVRQGEQNKKWVQKEGKEPPFSLQAPTTATPWQGCALLIPHWSIKSALNNQNA